MLDKDNQTLMTKVTENEEAISIALPQEYNASLDVESIFTNTVDQNNSDDGTGTSPTCLIILNQKIDILPELFSKLWENADLKICADGGGNALYNFNREYTPDYIVGDFDSLKSDVSKYYSSRGTIVIKQQTQFSSDLTKALSVMKLSFLKYFQNNNTKKKPQSVSESTANGIHKNYIDQTKENNGIEVFDGIHKNYIDQTKENNGIEVFDGIHQLDELHSQEFHDKVPDFKVICLNGIGGRFDQTVQSITHLYHDWLNVPCENKENGNRVGCNPKMIFVTSSDIIFKIPKGGFMLKYNEVMFDKVLLNCGILPVGNTTVVKMTKGLKWDVIDWPTSIQTGMVSSSNRFSNKTGCYIDMEDDVIMNVEINYKNLMEII